MAKGEGLAELGENRDALSASFTCSPLPVLQGSWKSILVGGRKGGSKIGRKRFQRAEEGREKAHQPQGQIRGKKRAAEGG